MKTLAVAEPLPTSPLVDETESALSREWRRLTRVATLIALLTSPSIYYWYHHHNGWSFFWSLVATFFTVVTFRGVVDVIVRRIIPWPSLFGTDDARLREDDIVNRRRSWTWNFVVRWAIRLFVFLSIIYMVKLAKAGPGETVSFFGTISHILSKFGTLLQSQAFWMQIVVVGFLFLANFLIFMGPLLMMGVSQIRGYEPGDAEWGVKLDDVRGQAEAKEEIRRVVTLWQSGEVFEEAGGKRERGLLFLGSPGTGKTMMAKAIATGFNSPFVSIPGSGFAQTFIGIDAIIVRFLARKAKKLARKWGGQCIVFIDEIDAVGMRRRALGGSNMTADIWAQQFYGPMGAVNPSGDLICENQAWRDWMFEQRAPERRSPYPGWFNRLNDTVNQGIFPGNDGRHGRRSRAQPAARDDGRDRQPAVPPPPLHEQGQLVPRRDLRRAAAARQDLGPRLRAGDDGDRRVLRRRGHPPAAQHRHPGSDLDHLRRGRRDRWSASRAGGRRPPTARPRCASRGRDRAARRSTSSARRTCRWRTSTPRSPGRAGWAATSTSARRRRKTARTSSTCTSTRSRTTRPSTRPRAATRSRGSRTATRRR